MRESGIPVFQITGNYVYQGDREVMTERLYYEDSHRKEFTAKVISCRWDEKKACYGVILDRTVFFPEGGGQYADPGVLRLADHDVPVLAVREQDGEIVHYLKEKLEPGMEVEGLIDYEERFSRMQQHSGEHIVSGLMHRHFGYDNVGFHLGQELVTMDFSGSLTEEQLRMVEREANGAVARNLPIVVEYPSPEELDALAYRSKKELSGQVRIVTIPGYDVCACCAPHVERTGEIGMIKLVDAVKYKGGTRVTMMCGFRALQDYQMKEDNVKEISRLLSVKPHEVADGVKRLQAEMQQWKDKLYRMQSSYLERKLEEMPADAVNYLVFEPEMDKNLARKFVDAGMRQCSGICGIFLGNDETGYQYTLGSEHVNLRERMKEFHEAFPGKGGGKPEMVQGTVNGKREEMELFLL